MPEDPQAQLKAYSVLESMTYTAAAALLFNGICLVLFSSAVFFLLKTKTIASRIFLAISIVLVIFSIIQTILDIAGAAAFSRLMRAIISGDTAEYLLSLQNNWARLYNARAGLTVTNNAISDCIFLYRCAVIWTSSPYRNVVVGVPAVLILATLIVGYLSIFLIDVIISIPYIMAFITNALLLGLTVGRIWRKGRDATLLLGPDAGARYTATIAIILLYVLIILIYLISLNVTDQNATVPSIVWGAIPQVLNIIPLMIMVRVGIARTFAEQESRGSVPLFNASAPLISKSEDSEYSGRPSGAYSARGAYSEVDA
ncbi:hypothetical protein B0H17DRAFT_450685 [Mycena rosella]|uniref:Uncharacterized protein n=1 Tax=Mycena rosella TaxID=1033263 RepID=A0AAD7MAI9_MYCRO|nr:hypothetical protein B0H17DRAFT_450685 [Mycena rosella]